MPLLFRALLTLLAAAIFGATPADARRVALVIGNGAYSHAERLANPTNDADAVAVALKRMKFDHVTLHRDLTADGMRRALGAFAAEATGADVAIVFYAGHGIEVDGQNYLIPSDARLTRSAVVELETIPLTAVTGAIAGAQKLRLVILDACRNNPFRAKMAAADTGPRRRSIGRGLARIEPGDNELIAFAAAGGTEADDGAGRHSPFTAALLKSLETPGLEVRVLFGAVRDDVLAATSRGQTPHVYGTLGREAIYLVPPDAAGAKSSAEAEIARRVAAEKARLEAEMAARLEAERKRIPSSPPATATVVPAPTPAPTAPSKGKLVTRAGALLHTFDGHPDMVLSVAFAPGTIFSAGHDGTLKSWSLEKEALNWSVKAHDGATNAVAVSRSGFVATAGSDGLVKKWDVAKGKGARMNSFKIGTKSVTTAAIDRHSNWIAAGGANNSVMIWDANSERLIGTIDHHVNAITSLAFASDFPTLVIGSRDKTITVWRLNQVAWGSSWKNLERTINTGGDAVSAVAITPDGKLVISGSWDRLIKVWDRASGELVRTLEGHEGEVYSLAVTPDGAHVLSASHDKTVRLWEIASGKLVRVHQAHAAYALAVAISQDGMIFASGGCDEFKDQKCVKGLVKYWALVDRYE
ncbi:MAG TPA: caspase family protein [Hyphomicrobiaceae bacterium]|nr:caspase family protein [Hyphomicrobiaceae bacterium]